MCPELVSITGSPVLTLTSAQQNQLSHIPIYTLPNSPKWISSFLSCCSARRWNLPPRLTPFTICQRFCTTNVDRRTSPAFFFPSSLALSVLPHCLAVACSAEITTFNCDCSLGDFTFLGKRCVSAEREWAGTPETGFRKLEHIFTILGQNLPSGTFPVLYLSWWTAVCSSSSFV